ncbi:MAG: DUF2189 domain-containing protein [Methylotenera sp.]|nr:DUF2189 domain-containing protein [Methylotenera sp.]
MSDTELKSTESLPSAFPTIRKVNPSNILNWLHAGVEDTRRGGLASLFYGVFFAAAGWLMQVVFAEAYGLFAGLTTGFLLLGPFLAMGLYDLSRRMELGEQPKLTPSLTAWRPNILNVGLFAGLLVVVLLIWARASLVIFALFFEGGLPTFTDVVLNVITLKQPIFAIVYFAVGGAFAAFVFAISVVAVPLMADRKTDAITASLASIIACTRNPLTMLLWGFCIVVLVSFGFATHFLGLIITMPIVGHATWHVYRDVVEADTYNKSIS